MAFLFGSRFNGDFSPSSDVDVLMSTHEFLAVPPELLVDNGGSLDAFLYPYEDGIALSLPRGDRRLVLVDKHGSRIEGCDVHIASAIEMARSVT